MREADRPTCWDEPTFWYLLAVEAARARRDGRPFLMLVADVRGTGASGVRRRRAGTPDLATALARCLREADLVGWHRTGRRAGAILTQGDADPASARVVGSKVLRGLQAVLPANMARALQVRIYRYGLPDAPAGFDRVFAAGGAAEATSPAPAASTPPPALTAAASARIPLVAERIVSSRGGI